MRAWNKCNAIVIALVAVAGCDAPDKSADPADAPTRVAASAPNVPVELDPDGTPKRYSVVVYGYNYTDTYIDSFEVDGAGGGNLEVSIPTAGGGGHTCCVMLLAGTPVGYEYKVVWTRDRRRWCEQMVALTKPLPPDPRYLEVHFYVDGHIEVEATHQASAPRLALDRYSRGERHEVGNVNNDEKFARCRNARD